MFAQAHAQHLNFAAGRLGLCVEGVRSFASDLFAAELRASERGLTISKRSDMQLVGREAQAKVAPNSTPWYPTSGRIEAGDGGSPMA